LKSLREVLCISLAKNADAAFAMADSALTASEIAQIR